MPFRASQASTGCPNVEEVWQGGREGSRVASGWEMSREVL